MQKRHRQIFILAVFSATIISCKKDSEIILNPPDTSAINPEKVTDYYPLSIGSYWVYRKYTIDSKVDSNIKEVPYPYEDSIYIEKDTTINGTVYAKFVWFWDNKVGSYYLRDSLDYIVNERGKFFFLIPILLIRFIQVRLIIGCILIVKWRIKILL